MLDFQYYFAKVSADFTKYKESSLVFETPIKIKNMPIVHNKITH